jgi:hypothetical protein
MLIKEKLKFNESDFEIKEQTQHKLRFIENGYKYFEKYYNYYAFCKKCEESHYINDEGYLQINGREYTKCKYCK